jgi:hypothetical protein
VSATKNDDVAHEDSVPHDDAPVQNGISVRDRDAFSRATHGNVVYGRLVCHVHGCAGYYVWPVFRYENDGQRKDGKARKNAYVHAVAP